MWYLVASSEKDIKCRKGQAWGTFWKMEKIFKSPAVDINTKVRIFQAPVRKYAFNKPSEKLGSTKQGRKAIDFTSYIADIINNNTNLTAQEIEAAWS